MKILELPRLNDHRGTLSFVENKTHIPFNIKKSYWIYDVPFGEVRYIISPNKVDEVIIALSGGFSVAVEEGLSIENEYFLNRPYEGLYLSGLTRKKLYKFSADAVALILASEYYENVF